MKAIVPSIVSAAILIAASAFCRGQNVHPDPGFEVTGEPGVARSGARAGHLAVGARNHWSAIGGRIEVQPFAKYRVAEWVRARVGGGIFYGPYCYEWDNYEWAFVSAHPIQSSAEWVQTETTFISPHKTMYVHPLAHMDADNGDAWVDDIVVEKVASPQETMAEIAAKPVLSEDEERLLARWRIARGDFAGAADVLRKSEGLTRADIATSIALSIRQPMARRPYVIEAIAYGGPSYNDGLKRFREMTTGMTDADHLNLCAEALRRNPGLDRAGRSLHLVAGDMLGAPGSLATTSEASARLAPIRAKLNAILAELPAGATSILEVKEAMKQMQSEQEQLARRREELGRCVVRIGGKAVTQKTHAIVIPESPTPQESYAARELRYHLELITGGALQILHERELAPHAPRLTPLFIGRCKNVPATLKVDFKGLGLEGIHVKTSGPDILFAGNRRGVLYAVSTFLEDLLGCRWFTPDCATWPRQGTIDIPALNHRYIPPLEYRAGDYPVLQAGDFAARLRMNGRVNKATEEQGGTLGVQSLAHTFAALVPPEKYFKEHPEYFSLVGGQRQSGYAQLCLTNPGVLKIVIQGVRKWIKEMPDQTVFSVSQNDTANYCECPNCAAVAKAEGSESGPMLRFVNAVAADIAKDHPNVAIETLAYQYTRKPPKITKPLPNVIVCLCSIECCFIHPLGDDPYNRSFVDDIVGWSKICKRLWIWDYIINYAHSVCPFPNLHVLKPNIRFFIDHGVRGIYEESCYYTKGSELQELRNYIIGKTLWYPSYDTGKAIDEFCVAYYGAAGPFVRRYVDLIHSATQQDPKLHVMIYTHPRQYVTQDMLAQARSLFDQAEAAVKAHPTLLHRVEVARLPILYAEIALATGGTLAEKGDSLVQSGGTDVTALAKRFERIARAEGLTQVREGGSDATLDAWLTSIPRQPGEVKIERLKNAALEVDVLPAVGGRIWRIRQLPSGRNLLRVAGTESARTPLEGGYEEYSESEYHSPGWNQEYSVVERGDRSITLQADLSNGLRLRRKIELDESRAAVKISSTLTNTGTAPRKACLRIHPEFAVSSMGQASVRIRRADGSWQTIALANPADPNAEKDMWLRGDSVPEGAWEIVDPAAGVTITNKLLAGRVGQCLLNWSGTGKRVNLEVYSQEAELAPGASIALEHSYEVTGR